jgi:hypothetical protein
MPAMPVSTRFEVSRTKRASLQLLWWSTCISALLAAGYVYYAMFTGFSAYDDDGYLLIGIRSLLQGRRLYDEIYSQYGPFYDLVHWIAYSMLRHPVTHDAERFISIVFWLVSAILWARVVYGLTRSAAWAAWTFLLAIRLLSFFPYSAGHPEEICMVLVSTLAILACGFGPMRSGWRAAAIGCVIAALALTKANIGAYLIIAIGLVLLNASPPTPLERYARFLFVSAGVVLPVAVMGPLLGFGWTRIFCFTATVSIAAVIFLGHRVAAGPLLTPRLWWTCVLSMLGCALAITVPFFLHGTSPGAMLYMTVLQHAAFARNWYLAPPVGRKVLLADGVSLVVAIACLLRRRNENHDWIGLFLPALKGVVGLGCLVAVVRSSPDQAAISIFRYAVPFVWLLLVDPADSASAEERDGVFALCIMAVFVYLYAFPVAGSQIYFAALPAGIVGILLLRDSALRIARMIPSGLPYRRSVDLAGAATFLLILAVLGRDLRRAHRTYANGVSLGMPGAGRIRVAPEVAGLYRWMKLNLDSCPAIYSMPGLFSLYLWTGKESPTDLTMSNSIGLLNEGQQRTVASDLSRYPGMCIVYSPALVEFWRRGQDLSRSPLMQYIKSEFTPTAEHDGYFVLKRK